MIPIAGRLRGPIALGLSGAASYTALGFAVSGVPPSGIDIAARSVTGEAPGIAWIFTASCLWPTLTVFGVIGCVVAGLVPAWRARIAFAIVTTLVGWQVSNLLKERFGRPRPAYWIVHHETTYAYSSGHAMFAVLVYWLWAYFIARSSLPGALRAGIVTLLTGWGGGVIWSRLALGAHYPTDLIGGVLLALTMLALAATVARVFWPRARIA